MTRNDCQLRQITGYSLHYNSLHQAASNDFYFHLQKAWLRNSRLSWGPAREDGYEQASGSQAGDCMTCYASHCLRIRTVRNSLLPFLRITSRKCLPYPYRRAIVLPVGAPEGAHTRIRSRQTATSTGPVPPKASPNPSPSSILSIRRAYFFLPPAAVGVCSPQPYLVRCTIQ